MILVKYRVTNFRSVQDSGWIDCDNVTTLVGVNESGKSNLLLALWKLNPARGGKIDILHDMPVSKLSSLRKEPEKEKFVSAVFSLDAESAATLSNSFEYEFTTDSLLEIGRYYDGHYDLAFYTDNDAILSACDYDELLKAVLKEIPSFVYYSNYGNLSSKIYLPNVIKWLNGQTTPGIDASEDQVRTLRVLFEFVKLDPQEILDLGKEPKVIAMERTRNANSTPTAEEIKKAEDDKEERSLLLQSASKVLTKQFAEWWKQGEYRFRFEADGDYFRIWVADKVRTDEVGLELRSTGLQWFLSFYLIFLVESQAQHKNAVLLLDEAGLTLHPLAQKDLSAFFDSLSEKNQIINTTHSPFIVDTSNIDRCRVVYVDKEGYTVASSDLRQGADSLNERSIYAVHAAMGLSVSDIMLQGCQNVVVEGPSDQHYLNAVKAFLIREKLIAPKQDIVFVPSGGVKGVAGIVSLLGAKAADLPYVILDSDKSGSGQKAKLQSGLYNACADRLLETDTFSQVKGSEIEDIVPFELLRKGIDRLFITIEDAQFEEVYDNSQPILPQIEAFAKAHDIELDKGWKVTLAKSAKQALKSKTKDGIEDAYIDFWSKLFEHFC